MRSSVSDAATPNNTLKALVLILVLCLFGLALTAAC